MEWEESAELDEKEGFDPWEPEGGYDADIFPESVYFNELYPDDSDIELDFRTRDRFGRTDVDDWWHERHPVEPIMSSHNL